MTIDNAERALFVGTQKSIIHQFNLIQSSNGTYTSVPDDNNNPSHPVNVTESPPIHFQGHNAEITAIDSSFDGTLLVSGDRAGEVFIWDVGSRQVLRKIKGQKGCVD